MKALFLLVSLTFINVVGFSQFKKFCYTTYSGKYSMALSDDATKKATYTLYDNAGNAQKTMQGQWMLRDEGVYGISYVLTITWTGLNAGMQELKFVAQYDGYGNLQSIIDAQSRVWNSCK